MNVTRAVIYDLLPGYFAGELSADSVALVEAHLASDPELRALADAFRRRSRDRGDRDAAGEVPSFEKVRTRAQRLNEYRALAIGYALAVAFVLLFSSGPAERTARVALAFAATSGACAVAWALTRAGRLHRC